MSPASLECLNYIRELKALNIPVIFEKENINTMESSGELLLTILASISQQESASISENVRLGHIYNFQQGKGMLNPKYFMGYDRGDEPHTMVINPEQAIIVRRIFREFLEGFSPAMIATRLNQEHVPTATGKGKWFDTTIASILGNEKHCGHLLMQKYYTKDFLTHKMVRNDGKRQQYFVEDDHDPIVPKEIYYQVQGEMRRRSFLKSDPNKIRYGSITTLNGRTFCGKCGKKMKRGANGWRCEGRALVKKGEEGRCDLRNVKEDALLWAVIEAFNEALKERETLIRLQERVFNGDLKRIDALLEALDEEQDWLEEHQAREQPGNQTRMNEILRKKNALFFERAEKANQNIQIRILLELVDTVKHHMKGKTDTGEPCSDYEEFFELTRYIPPDGIFDCLGEMIRFDSSLVVRYLERVDVFENEMVVKFKAGVEYTIKK